MTLTWTHRTRLGVAHYSAPVPDGVDPATIIGVELHGSTWVVVVEDGDRAAWTRLSPACATSRNTALF